MRVAILLANGTFRDFEMTKAFSISSLLKMGLLESHGTHQNNISVSQSLFEVRLQHKKFPSFPTVKCSHHANTHHASYLLLTSKRNLPTTQQYCLQAPVASTRERRTRDRLQNSRGHHNLTMRKETLSLSEDLPAPSQVDLRTDSVGEGAPLAPPINVEEVYARIAAL